MTPPLNNKASRSASRLGSIGFLVCATVVFAVVAGHALFRSGYVLEVDTAWGQHSPPLDYGFYLPIAFVVRIAVSAVGGANTGKAYLLATFALCAGAPMIALRRQSVWIRLVCGSIGLFNPWVYERIVEGQWVVVAAGASLFLWIAAVDRLDERPDVLGAVCVALSGALVVALSPGFLAMLGILALARVAFDSRIADRPEVEGVADADDARAHWARVALALTGLFLVYGVVLFFFGHGTESLPRVQTFGERDLLFFRAQATPLGLPIRLIGFAGFWAERTGRFEALDTGWVVWPVGAMVLLSATIAGAWRNRDRSWILYVGLVGLVISGSTAFGPLRSIIGAAGRHLPLLYGFRDPEKFSALWLVATVMLLGSLLASMRDVDATSGGRPWRAPVAAAGIVAAVVMLGAGRIPGLLVDAIRPVKYPSDWYNAAGFMSQHAVDGRTVALPWHRYLPLPFAGGRVVQNPVDVFFPGNVLASEDPEIGGAPTGTYADIARAASRPRAGGCALARALRAHRVRQVVVIPVLEGPDDLVNLERCGFQLAEGGVSTVAVARDKAGG